MAERRNTYREDEALEKPFDIHHLMRAWVYIKEQAGMMLLALVISALGGVAGLISPLMVQKALDEAIPSGDIPRLYKLVGLVILSIVASVVFMAIRSLIMINVSQKIIYRIRGDLYEHLQKLSFQYYDSRPNGKILVRVVNYVNSVSDMLSNGLINMILEIINLIFIIIFMFAVDVQLSLVVLAGVPVLVIFMLWIKNRQRKSWQMVSNKNSNLNAYLQENIAGARITQIFAREDENYGIFQGLCRDCQKTWNKAVSYGSMIWPGIDVISVFVRAAIFISGIVLFGQGSKTLGVIVAMASYASRFWQPIMNLGNIFNNFINNTAYLERIFETMDEPVTVDDAPDATEMPRMEGEVKFENVTFSYEEGHEVLHNISFTVKPGESIALVGPTGAGKSTIVNLLSRFYDIQSGKILIDGHDISKVTLNSLRSQMGIMLQDSYIFPGTIADNIRYGKLDATESEIYAASRAVCAHDFIKALPDGYYSQVNERGSLLSQGQKQLISFARTLISDPAILVLDEATSSIDVQTEKALQKGLDEMLKGRTSFIIAHRLSTITKCDKIMYIDNGGILESGNHEELMQKKGEYYKLFTSQLDANTKSAV